jgi:hypothetical protein
MISLNIIFFEDYFTASVKPSNDNSFKFLKTEDSEKNLLYFFLNSDGETVRNDKYAKERFENDDKAAYGNFYNIIKTDSVFLNYDIELPLIDLIKDALNDIKDSFFKEIKENSDSYEMIPTNVSFIPSISNDSKGIILKKLKESKFNIENEVNYFDAFSSSLKNIGILKDKLSYAFIDTNFGDLFFYFIEYESKIIKCEEYVIPSKGVNHRIANLATLMVDKAAKATNSQLLNNKNTIEAEYKKHFKHASKELNNFLYSELDVVVNLSDHNTKRVRIDERELEKRDRPSFQLFKVSFDRFINEHSNLTLLQKIFLIGDVLDSKTFIDFFSKEYGSNKVVKPYEDFHKIISEGLISFTQKVTSSNTTKTSKISSKSSNFTPSAPSRPSVPSRPSAPSRPPAPPRPPKPSFSPKSNSSVKKSNIQKPSSAPSPPAPPRPPRPGKVVRNSETKKISTAPSKAKAGKKLPPPPPPPIPKK